MHSVIRLFRPAAPVTSGGRLNRAITSIGTCAFSAMLLVLGDSFAYWAGRRCDLGETIRTAGWRGGRIGDAAFRRWAIATVHEMKPQRVVLLVGGNDLTGEGFNTRQLYSLFQELTLGIAAAGASETIVFPIPPRSSCRRGDVSVAMYCRRRRLFNKVLKKELSRPQASSQASFSNFRPGDGFLGRDGVHPSAGGWQVLAEAITALV